MMIRALVILVFLPLFGFAQIGDTFSDGDFSHNPQWTGDSGSFRVTVDGRLQLYTLGADTCSLYTAGTWNQENEWRFWTRLAFNTSGNNFARVFLAGDSIGKGEDCTGLYLQLGGSADSIDLVWRSATETRHLYRFKSYSTAHSNNVIRFRILRNPDGVWSSYIDTTGGENFHFDGSFTDLATPPGASRLGVWCKFTSSNSTRFYFDDFYAGPPVVDSLPPDVVWAQVTGENEIGVAFSEVPAQHSACSTTNYHLSLSGRNPVEARQMVVEPTRVSLLFDPGLTEDLMDTLVIRGVTDLAGNPMEERRIPVGYHRAKPFEMLIHEIMADPDPSEGLPQGEYVELFNRTPFPISLNGWQISYGSSVRVFGEVTVPPMGYHLVCRDSVFQVFGSCSYLFTSSSSLSNEGATLTLRDDKLHVIHSVNYLPGWHGGTFKEDGGWSLEMIDTGNPCGCEENWGSSLNPQGGTPGAPNSVKSTRPDVSAPFPVSAYLTNPVTVSIDFSEPMDSVSLMEPTSWRVENGDQEPVAMVPVSPEFRRLEISFKTPFDTTMTYILHTTGPHSDCAGNRCDTSRSIRFAWPAPVTFGDVVINEILSNPGSGGSRYVELYNRSEKVVDIFTLLLSGEETTPGGQPDGQPVSGQGKLLFPGEYLVPTGDPADVTERYHPPWPERLIRMEHFPTLDDNEGIAVLRRKDDLRVIDRVSYTKEMHYPLLVTNEGVSLERVHPERAASDPENWHSAASQCGYGTPGYMNSQYRGHAGGGDLVTIDPAVFSPDNDGFDDLLSIKVSPREAGYVAMVVIYNVSGREIKQLAANLLLGSEGHFSWDGTCGDGTIAPVGIYLLSVELVHTRGDVERVRKAVVLGARL